MTFSSFFRAIAGAAGLAALAGCCANSVCNCEDQRADAISLQFKVRENPDLTDTTFFRPADVDTVYLRRFAVPLVTVAGRVSYDSVRLVRGLTQVGNPLVIDNNAPFAPVAGKKLNAFRYTVSVRPTPLARFPARFRSFALHDIVLKGSFEGNGCCTCYRNTAKTATLNGKFFDLAEQEDRRPVLLLLTR